MRKLMRELGIACLIAVGFLLMWILMVAGNIVAENRCREAGGEFAMAPIFLASTCTIRRN